jgi:hypothetical protein
MDNASRFLPLSFSIPKTSKRSLATRLCGGILAAFLSTLAAVASAQQPGFISTFAGNGTQGYVDGPASSAEFFFPSQLGFDPSGNLYVYDMDNDVIRKITPNGTVSTFAGTAGVGGPCCSTTSDGSPATSVPLGAIGGIVGDSLGNVYFSDGADVKMVNPLGIISTFAAPSGVASISALAIDSANNLYLGTSNRILKITPQGVTSTLAGFGFGDCSVGGTATSVAVTDIQGMAFDSNGNLYFSEAECFSVFKLSFADGTISKVAGTGTSGFSGDGQPAILAELSEPKQIAIDANNNIYIADWNPNDRIRVINSAGIISTFAGTGAQIAVNNYNGDNIPATSANLSEADGVAVDSQGNVYIGDEGSERIRKVIP